jgi:hypothetical protein
MAELSNSTINTTKRENSSKALWAVVVPTHHTHGSKANTNTVSCRKAASWHQAALMPFKEYLVASQMRIHPVLLFFTVFLLHAIAFHTGRMIRDAVT